MYKVFINDKPVILVNNKNTVKFSTAKIIDFEDFLRLQSEVLLFEEDSRDALVIYHDDLEELWNCFQSIFKVIEAAGGIVRNGEKVLTIYRNGFWDLPKGKLENDESVKEGALREVTEETGVDQLKVLPYEFITWHTYRTKKHWVLKKTSWFEMSTHYAEVPKPQIEEGISKVEWSPLSKIHDQFKDSFQSLKELLQDYSSYSLTSQ